MRKGRLTIIQAKSFKPGDVYFDKGSKLMVTVQGIEKGVVVGVTPNDQPCRVHPESLVSMAVTDRMTEEEFKLGHDQWGYMYKTCRESEFKFFDKIDHLSKDRIAVVFAKNNDMVSKVKVLAPIVDAYGMYVASQKSIGEPAKNFKDWYFDISV